MRNGKKCICKKCDECYFFRTWILTNDRGEQKAETKCSLDILFDEIPRIRGAVDGCQAAANEARNRTLEFGAAAVQSLQAMTRALPEFSDAMKQKLLEAKCQD